MIILSFVQFMGIGASPVVGTGRPSIASNANTLKVVSSNPVTNADGLSTEALTVFQPGARLSRSMSAVWSYNCPHGGAATKTFKWKAEVDMQGGQLVLSGISNIDSFDHTRNTSENEWTSDYSLTECRQVADQWCVFYYVGTTAGWIDSAGLHLRKVSQYRMPAVQQSCQKLVRGVDIDHCHMPAQGQLCKVNADDEQEI